MPGLPDRSDTLGALKQRRCGDAPEILWDLSPSESEEGRQNGPVSYRPASSGPVSMYKVPGREQSRRRASTTLAAQPSPGGEEYRQEELREFADGRAARFIRICR